MQNALKSTSFRKAVKIEHPEGVPLATGYSGTPLSKGRGEYGIVFDGNLLLTYEPPVVMKSIITVGVIGRINGTNDQFSGLLESASAGEIFAPDHDLVSSVRRCVQKMAEEMKETDQSVIAVVIEEILGYTVVNAPVKQIYEKIRIEFPIEFRALNLEYKRQTGKSIQENMMQLQSKQRLYKFSSAKSLVRTAFKVNELVALDDDKMDTLKKSNPGLYQAIQLQLKNIQPVNGKYIIMKSQDGKSFIAGRDQNSKTGYSQTDIAIPDGLLQRIDEDQDLENYSPAYAEKVRKQRYKENIAKQKGLMKNLIDTYFSKNNIPASVFSNDEEAKKYAEKISYIYDVMQKNGEEIPAEFNTLVSKVKATESQSSLDTLKKILSEVGIPESEANDIFHSRDIAVKNKSKIFDAYTDMQQRNIPIPKQFENLVNILRNKQDEQPAQRETGESVSSTLEGAGIPVDVLKPENLAVAQQYKARIMRLYNRMLQEDVRVPDEISNLVNRIK